MRRLHGIWRLPTLVGVAVVVAFMVGGTLYIRHITPSSQTAGGPPGGPPPGLRHMGLPTGTVIPVATAAVEKRDVPIYLNGLGTVQAFNTVTIHTRIDGELTEVSFREGQDVKTGQVLAKLDSRTYKATLEQAIATRDKDQATLESAQIDLRRYQELGNRVSGQTLDTQRATVKQEEAAVRADEASIDNAKAQLSYTTIVSPIDGRTGIRQVDRGNIVHSSDTSGIVTVSQMQPISLVFTLPQQNLRDIAREVHQQGTLPVQAVEADNKTIIDQGELALFDNLIDSTTGTIKLKATFPNANRELWPGGFVNVRLYLTTRHDAMTIPTQAIQTGPQNSYVYVVKTDQTVELRPVTLGPAENGDTVIEKGLTLGETVVTEGMARLQPGAKVSRIDSTSSEKTDGKAKSGEQSHQRSPRLEEKP